MFTDLVLYTVNRIIQPIIKSMDYEKFVDLLSPENREKLYKKVDELLDVFEEVTGQEALELGEDLDVVHELNMLSCQLVPLSNISDNL